MAMIQSAVIGIHGIGKWHGQMMRDTKRMEVAAVCDVDESMREVAAKEFPTSRFYTSYKEMFAKEKLDLVSVVTPHDLHAPIAIAATFLAADSISSLVTMTGPAIFSASLTLSLKAISGL